MPALRLKLFGSPRLEMEGRKLPVSRRKSLALLAYLALKGPEIRREELAVLLWPELDRERSLAALRRTLVSLNRVLRGAGLRVSRQSLALEVGQDFWVDALAFQQLVTGRIWSEPAEEARLQEAAPFLVQAVEIYQGDFLSGFTLRDSEEFDHWQVTQTEYFRKLYGQTLRQLVDTFSLARDFDKGVHYGRLWLRSDPLNEEAHRALMKLYSWQERRSAALRQYAQCVSILERELQVKPEPETQALHEQIRQGTPPPPPVGSEESTSHVHLPRPPTLFVGRTEELNRLIEHLQDPGCRLLTVIGPGGMGKTRLAVETGYQAIPFFPGGVFFIPLAATTSPELLPTVLLEHLGASWDPQLDTGTQLISFLQQRNALLILDNFEHLLEGASLLGKLVQRCPRAKFLVTSRERLQLSGEWVYELTGLSFPEQENQRPVSDFSAVRLFLETSKRLGGPGQLPAEEESHLVRICQLVKGMPLAIELAASWSRALSVGEIAAEIETNLDFLSTTMRDFPERHRSLRAVFDYSYALCSEPAQLAFQRLSVFRSSFDREAAQAVADAGTDVLLALVDKSLLTRTSRNRFEMHQLLRQYARELWDPTREQELHQKHGRYFLGRLQELTPHLLGYQQLAALDKIRQSLDDIRGAWNWALANRDQETVELGLEGLFQFYLIMSRFQEGADSLHQVVQVFSDVPLLRARAAIREARFRLFTGRLEAARQLCLESLEILRQSNLPGETALAKSHLSTVLVHLGDYDEARSLLEEAIQVYQQTRDRSGTADGLLLLGRLTGFLGREEEARRCLKQAIALYQELGNQDGVARAYVNLGNIIRTSGHPEEARGLYEAGLEIFEKLGDRKGMALCLGNLGLVNEDMGRHQEAMRISQQALRLIDDIGFLSIKAQILENLGRASFGLGQLPEAEDYYQQVLYYAQQMQQSPVALIALLGLARIAAQKGEAERAVALLYFILGHPALDGETRGHAERFLEQLCPRLSATALQRAQEESRSWELQSLAEEILGTEAVGSSLGWSTRHGVVTD